MNKQIIDNELLRSIQARTQFKKLIRIATTFLPIYLIQHAAPAKATLVGLAIRNDAVYSFGASAPFGGTVTLSKPCINNPSVFAISDDQVASTCFEQYHPATAEQVAALTTQLNSTAQSLTTQSENKQTSLIQALQEGLQTQFAKQFGGETTYKNQKVSYEANDQMKRLIQEVVQEEIQKTVQMKCLKGN